MFDFSLKAVVGQAAVPSAVSVIRRRARRRTARVAAACVTAVAVVLVMRLRRRKHPRLEPGSEKPCGPPMSPP
jgi:hypothetical protein